MWKDAVIQVLHKKKDPTDCGNYRGVSLVAHATKFLLKIVALRLDLYPERECLLRESQCGFRLGRSTVEMMFVVRRLQELGRKEGFPIYMLSGSPERARLCRPLPFVGCSRVIWGAAGDGRYHASVPR